MGMFEIFKITPARALIKQTASSLQGKEQPKPIESPAVIVDIWDSKPEMRTIFFDAKGGGTKPIEARESRLTSADIAALTGKPYRLWPKKPQAQMKYHDAKRLWSRGKTAKEIAQSLGFSLSVAEKVTAAFNSVHEANAGR